MSEDQFFKELRGFSSIPVVGMGVEYEAGAEDRTGCKGVELDCCRSKRLFAEVVALLLPSLVWVD